VKFFWVTDTFVGIFELIDLLDQLGLGLHVREHLSSDQHFVEDQARTPDVALLVILFQLQNLGSGVERCACALGHLDFHVPGQSEISDLEFFVFVKQDIIRLEVPVQFVCIDEGLLSLLM